MIKTKQDILDLLDHNRSHLRALGESDGEKSSPKPLNKSILVGDAPVHEAPRSCYRRNDPQALQDRLQGEQQKK